MENLKFNCGGYLPGKLPLTALPTQPPVPNSVIIIIGGPVEPGIPNYEPKDPPPPIINPPGGQPPAPGNPGGRGPGAPTTGGGPQPGAPTNPGGVPPGIPGTTGGPQPGAPTTPLTTARRYRCTQTIFYCYEDRNLPIQQRRVREIKRFCSTCTQQLINGRFQWADDCIYLTKPDCVGACQDSGSLNPCLGRPITGSSSTQVPTSPGGVVEPNIPQIGSPRLTQAPQDPQLPQIGSPRLTQAPQDPQLPQIGSPRLTQAPQDPQLPQIGSPKIPTQSSELLIVNSTAPTQQGNTQTNFPVKYEILNTAPQEDNPNQNVVANKTTDDTKGSFYNKKYNLFSYVPDESYELVRNSNYRSIFGETITKEVSFFLNNIDAIKNWNEKIIFDLTKTKISISLNPQLLEAISNLHYLGGMPIPVDLFLETIRKHLLEGTIKLFDPAYYLQLYRKQKTDTRFAYAPQGNQQVLERASLGYLAKKAISADAENFGSIQKSQLKRQKRLNVDIAARVTVESIDDDDAVIYLEEDGMPITDSDTISLGDGYGYYLKVETTSSGDIPLIMDTDVSSSLFVPAGFRYNALKVINEDPVLEFRVSSLTGDNEFSSSSVSGFEVKPYFFKLDLSSVTDGNNSNPLINRVTCNYILVTNQDEIDTETKNYGFATTRMNIPVDDPFFRYAVQSSSINLEQNDITFRNFQDNRTLVDNAILTRNIPFGLVMTPVAGSKYNPFNGNSQIESYTNSIVARVAKTLPAFDISDEDRFNVELKETNLLNETGEAKVGLLEDTDLQGIGHFFSSGEPKLVNNFLSSNLYISSAPTLENYGYSYLINNILDPILAADSTLESITWWDVYSRMSINRFCELFYDIDNSSVNLHQKLANGLRESVKIKNVLGVLSNDDINIIENDSPIIDSNTRR